MNIVREALDSQRVAPATMTVPRPMYWSLRREVWENRWIYISPLAIAFVFLVGYVINLIHLRVRMARGLTRDSASLHEAMTMPYEVAAGLIMAAVFVIQIFYCLEALHGERRDRSILFWKSLPVSDLTTVLSKAGIVALMPFLAFAITVATHLIMLLLSSAVLLGSGVSVAAQWTQLSWLSISLMLLYHLVTVHVLWYAPIYGWLMLVSAWARRAAFLWAVLPPLAIVFAERIAFGTAHFLAMLQYRFSGPESFNFGAGNGLSMDPMKHLSLLRFLSTPGLWIGFAVAAGFLVGAVRLRRYRGPI